jgi:hypothetical protein
MGRRQFEPTGEQRQYCERMASIGIAQDQIARVLGISANTLRKHFAPQLDAADLRALVAVANNLFQLATRDDYRAVVPCIFWLKTRAGWKETSTHELTGANGAPLDLSNVSDADLELLEQISERTVAAAARRDADEPPAPPTPKTGIFQ